MIAVKKFGKLSNGKEITAITISNGKLKVRLLDYGARVQSLVYAQKDVVLGYDDADRYERCTSFQGATVGRFANRIDNGRFILNGTEYDVGRNSGKVHLHGGQVGFDKVVWEYETAGGAEPSVTFSHVSPDGDMGYPGTLKASVRFCIKGESLEISYNADTDADTVISLTNHCYFNLDGEGDVLSTLLRINASAITPIDEKMIPTGEFLLVGGTPFDFRKPRKIGECISDNHPQLILGGGYDHNFVLDGSGMRVVARAFSEKSGITLECRTDRPGLQLYTCNFPDDVSTVGKGGAKMSKHQAFCLETQGFPDAPNKPSFPSAVLKKGERFISKTVYSFSEN